MLLVKGKLFGSKALPDEIACIVLYGSRIVVANYQQVVYSLH
jgi:hypothetical protein